MAIYLDMDVIDNLDLEDEQDQIKLAGMISDLYKGSQSFLSTLAYKWEENVRFFLGEQHIYYDDNYRRFQPIPVTKFNEFVPRPVTNYILSIVQTLVSIYTRRQPTIKVRPNSIDSMDKNAAKLSDRIIDAKWEEDDEHMNAVRAALIVVLTGTVIRKDYWDPMASQMMKMPDLKNASKSMEMPLGDNAAEIIDPFRFIPDFLNENYFLQSDLRNKNWIKSRYGKTGNGYTWKADQVKGGSYINYMMELSQKLKTSTGIGTGGRSADDGGSTKDEVMVLEVYIKPTMKHKQGIMAVVAEGVPLYINKVPYFTPKVDDSWHPYSFCKFQDVHFRWHGLSLVENLVPLQRRINSIDALTILNRMTMTVPQWLMPKGAQVPEGYINGQPGLVVQYSPVGAQGAKPEKVPGIGLPADVYKERDTVLQAMHMISGTNEVLAGSRPEGVNTAAAMQMLLEQSYSKFNPFIQRWEKFLANGQSKKLRIIQKFYQEPRKDFIERLKVINKENLDVQINDFIGAHLMDNFDVRIDAGSSLPRSEIVEQQNYKELAQAGLFGSLDPNENPIGNEKFLDKFGIKVPHSEMNADVKRAIWVNSVLTSINRGEMEFKALPPILEIDNLDIHYKILTDRMKAPDFKDDLGLFKIRLSQIQAMQAQQAQQAALAQPNVSPGGAPAMPGPGGQIPPGPQDMVSLPNIPPELLQQIMGSPGQSNLPV